LREQTLDLAEDRLRYTGGADAPYMNLQGFARRHSGDLKAKPGDLPVEQGIRA
jgi:hypothetical protein